MPFSPNSSSCPKILSSEYQLYACGNFFGHSSILEKIAILGQPPSRVSLTDVHKQSGRFHNLLSVVSGQIHHFHLILGASH